MFARVLYTINCVFFLIALILYWVEGPANDVIWIGMCGAGGMALAAWIRMRDHEGKE